VKRKREEEIIKNLIYYYNLKYNLLSFKILKNMILKKKNRKVLLCLLASCFQNRMKGFFFYAGQDKCVSDTCPMCVRCACGVSEMGTPLFGTVSVLHILQNLKVALLFFFSLLK